MKLIKKQIEFAEPTATPIKPSFFCNNSQDSHKYSNSAEISSILGAPNQVGTSGAATSSPPSRSAYAYSAPNFKLNSSSAQDPPWYSIEYVHEQLTKMLREHYGIEPTVRTHMYHKPYPEIYDSYSYPPGFRVPKFVKSTREYNRTTWEHVSQFLAQMGEASLADYLKVRLFSMSLFDIAFSWFSALPPGSILAWAHLEQRFHDHFYSWENELKLSHLTSVEQQHDEYVVNYIKRFREMKNRCFSFTISDKDLADLLFNGLCSYVKEKLEGHLLTSVNQVLDRALAQENWSKELAKSKSNHPNMHFLNNNVDTSDDESGNVYAAEFTWASKDKAHTSTSLKPIHRNRWDEMKFTFDVLKCDKIFVELLSIRKIKLSHTIPLIEDIKSVLIVSGTILILMLLMIAMYFGDKYNWLSVWANCVSSKCRWTTTCFSSMPLCLKQMQVDNDIFPINAIDLQGAKMMVRPKQAKSTKGKNVIIGKERPKSSEDKIWWREVVPEKIADAKDVLKIIVKASGLRGQVGDSKQDRSFVQQNTQSWLVRPVAPTGQTSRTMVSRPKMLKPKNPEVDEWKVVKAKIKYKKKNFKPIFDNLLSKYVKQKTESRDRSSKGSAAPSLK
jgi:hypothetical protein